jgi:quercetin dioxygenase-like cupin family protein
MVSETKLQRRSATMTRLMLVAGTFLAMATAAVAEGGALNANGLRWGEVPPVFPKGAQLAVVSGDPRMPPGHQIPAHHHPTAEYVTVLSGSFHIGMGDRLDQGSGQELRAGGFAEAPAGMNHYAWASSATVVQVHGQGPFALTYVNPADDPSKAR